MRSVVRCSDRESARGTPQTYVRARQTDTDVTKRGETNLVSIDPLDGCDGRRAETEGSNHAQLGPKVRVERTDESSSDTASGIGERTSGGGQPRFDEDLAGLERNARGDDRADSDRDWKTYPQLTKPLGQHEAKQQKRNEGDDLLEGKRRRPEGRSGCLEVSRHDANIQREIEWFPGRETDQEPAGERRIVSRGRDETGFGEFDEFRRLPLAQQHGRQRSRQGSSRIGNYIGERRYSVGSQQLDGFSGDAQGACEEQDGNDMARWAVAAERPHRRRTEGDEQEQVLDEIGNGDTSTGIG